MCVYSSYYILLIRRSKPALLFQNWTGLMLINISISSAILCTNITPLKGIKVNICKELHFALKVLKAHSSAFCNERRSKGFTNLSKCQSLGSSVYISCICLECSGCSQLLFQMYQESFKVLCDYSPRSNELHRYGWSWSGHLCSWQVRQGGQGLGAVEATTFSFCLIALLNIYQNTILAASNIKLTKINTYS